MNVVTPPVVGGKGPTINIRFFLSAIVEIPWDISVMPLADACAGDFLNATSMLQLTADNFVPADRGQRCSG
jgi:hypothetical protein